MKSQSKIARGELSRTVYVAMSGGVDSSVAAALLKKQGYNVTGVFMRPWSPNPQGQTFGGSQGSTFNYCFWKQDREDALRAAAVLGIPFLTWDFSKEYKKEVGDYMLREYKAGRTPNPDVMCNKKIKFGLFFKKALKEGADYIATGHYVKLRRGPVSAYPHRAHYHSARWGSPSRATPLGYSLYVAMDTNKDQSYFLWTLTQEQLKYCIFPIGDYSKPEVRKLAKKFGLPNHDKKDSQGVCFIGPLNMKDFLKKYIKPKSGEIRLHRLHGAHVKHGHHVTVGKHDGVYYYTIGQRHGLDIKNGQGPYFVVGKDMKKNIIYVADKETRDKRQETRMRIKQVNWIGIKPKLPAKVGVRIRYRSKSVPAIISSHKSRYKIRDTRYNIHFLRPVRAITPGQSAVFYKGEELLGGGIIS